MMKSTAICAGAFTTRDRQYLIPYINSAREFRADLRLFASPWSPPTWLKYPKLQLRHADRRAGT